MKLIDNRYKLLDILTKDVYGTTYVASDLSNESKKILLKIIDIENKDKKLINFLMNNFSIIASINHLYIQKCNSFDVINTIDNKKTTDFQYFYTTEYIGDSFNGYKGLWKLEVDDIFIKLCYALNYLHFRGMTYKFLNFENIMTAHKEGNTCLKLRDLVTIYQQQENNTSIKEYNAQFIAPEIKSGRKGNNSSDIYSLGVIYFYLISGLDYRKNNFKEVFKKNNNDYLAQTIEKMTEPDPSSRYKNILELINHLKQYLVMDYVFSDKSYYEKLNFNMPLISRVKGKNFVLDSINGKLLGKLKSNYIFIHGEAGIGKSRFVREINFQIKMNKLNTCLIELSQENSGRFYIYKRILRFIVKNNKINSDLIDKYGSELVKILPDLVSMWDVKPSETLIEEKEILRLNNRIYNFINDFTSKNSLIIIIDNIHYAHKNDLNILEYLVENTKNSSLIIISTYTDEESFDINELLCRLGKKISTSFINLSKLNFKETALMLKNILGMDHKPLKLTTKIMEETNGNPRYIEEIVKSLFMNKQIIVDEGRRWVVDIDDIYNLQLPASMDDAILSSIHSLDLTTRNVLNIISIFYTPVSLETIIGIVDKDENIIVEILANLVSLRIINEKFEDWGYSYDYYDKYVKKFVYNNISNRQKNIYHLNAANILEKFYISEGRDYTIELVYHFINCGETLKAIKYCIKAAEKMEQLHIYNQAIIFYNRAIDLLKDYDDPRVLIDVLMKIGDIYVLVGEFDDAFEIYSRSSIVSHGNQLQKHLIDTQNKLAYIYLYRNEIDTAEKLLKNSIDLSKELGYIDGEIEAALLQCKLYGLTKTNPNFKNLLNKYINMSLKYSKNCYAGEFFNEKGKLYYEEGKMAKAEYCYEQSIFFFEKSNNSIKTTSPLNNIGIVYLEAHKNIGKAREYYNKALSLFEKYNYITDKGIFLMNIGETYLYEDKYSDAINYLNKAVDISLEIGDTSILFSSYIHLCDTYINLYQYDKAYFYLKKLELEFESYNRYDSYYYDYYFIHINFYTEIHNYYLAHKWNRDLSEALKDKKIDFDLKQRILELRMYEIQACFHIYKSIDVDEIKYFLFKNLDKVHLKRVRNFLVNLIYILILKNEIDCAKYFIDLDESLIYGFNTDILSLKRSFALGLFSDNKIEFFKELLSKLKNVGLYEYEWRVFKILGDEYYKKNDYFNALSNYVTSLDILKSLTYRIPEGLRENYIFNYDIHLVLKEKIEDLKEKILNKKNNKSRENSGIKLNKSLEEFFDFSDLNILFGNEKFMSSVYNESIEESSLQITNLTDLIQNLKKDELYNIQLILKYCARMCLAERGFVFITNKNNDIQEIINIGNHKTDREVKNFLKNISHKAQNIVFTNQNQFKDKGFNHREIKSLICIPIKNSDKEGLLSSDLKYRRRYENKFYSKEIVGYLYLDTKRVFNNFTHEAYEKCCALINLLYVMIQNYDLKKISSIDKLTNLYLRKHIEDLFKKEIIFAQKNEASLSVVMCDIDKFKHVNDFYGHRKGDEVLAKIGEILKGSLRKSDLVGRYGGEEFIIILPETDMHDAYIVCEKLRKVIEDSKIMGANTAVTMSFGISSYPNHGIWEDELIERADQALYKSKKSGRNKTTIWNKNIGHDKHRYDKLAGIITGDISTDHRNVNFIIDIIELLKDFHYKADRVFKVLGYLIEISESEYGAIFETEGKTIVSIHRRKRASNRWVEKFKFNETIINEFIGKKQGDFFIDWNDISEIDGFTGIPNWNSFIIIPLINNDIQKGILLLSVPINEKEFDFSTFNLVNSLSGIIASML